MNEEMFIAMLAIIVGAILIAILLVRDKNRKKETPTHDWDATQRKADALCEMFAKDVKVYAKRKDGKWYEGISLGYQDWRLFTTFFLVKFNDGEILKLPSEDMSLIKRS